MTHAHPLPRRFKLGALARVAALAAAVFACAPKVAGGDAGAEDAARSKTPSKQGPAGFARTGVVSKCVDIKETATVSAFDELSLLVLSGEAAYRAKIEEFCDAASEVGAQFALNPERNALCAGDAIEWRADDPVGSGSCRIVSLEALLRIRAGPQTEIVD